jgi:alpha-1,3-rhamnosyl/mannosyltransferase
MRILINQIPAFGPRTGVGHYTRELLRCLREQTTTGEIRPHPYACICHLRNWARSLISGRASVGPADNRGKLVALLRGGAKARHYFRLVAALRHFDLYHEPNFIPMPVDLPTVVTLHDLSVVLHPEWHPPERVAHFEGNLDKAVARSRHFFAISESGRQEIIRTLGIRPHDITCTYMGIRDGLRPMSEPEVAPRLRQLGLPPRYLLCLGTIEPRKNVLRLLHAYCALPAALRDRWPLLLVGGWGWRTEAVAEFYHNEARHRGVRHIGYLPDDQLAIVYNGARALVFPSLYEGFGLPPIEMMACGGAVLASTAASVVEVTGGRAQLIDPEDGDGWHAAMARVLQDDDWWQSLRKGTVEVARRFTWDRCAADTLYVYRTLTGSTARSPHQPRAA